MAITLIDDRKGEVRQIPGKAASLVRARFFPSSGFALAGSLLHSSSGTHLSITPTTDLKKSKRIEIDSL